MVIFYRYYNLCCEKTSSYTNKPTYIPIAYYIIFLDFMFENILQSTHLFIYILSVYRTVYYHNIIMFMRIHEIYVLINSYYKLFYCRF